MAGFTLTQARDHVRQLADDSAPARWTDAQVDRALQISLNRELIDYATRGGDRFDLDLTGSSSATTGTLDVTSVVPLLVKSVVVTSGSVLWQVPAKGSPVQGYPDLVARSLTVRYVREYVLPTTTTHPLVGVGAAAANTFDAFDSSVCIGAATIMLVKDAELRAPLQAELERNRASVIGRGRTPRGTSWPRGEFSPLADDICWQFKHPGTVYLTRRGW